MAQKDGGPAFPDGPFHNPNNDTVDWGSPGLSKREWFAGLAMQGIISSSEGQTNAISDTARIAVVVADALLAELAKDD